MLFYPLAALCTVGALGVVLARNPLHGALWLVTSFFFLSRSTCCSGAHFVGILQIIVYAGAIMVLFLFVIMLLALTEADLASARSRCSRWPAAPRRSRARHRLAGALQGAGRARAPAHPTTFGTVAAVGSKLFNDLPLQFETVSLLLHVAIAGAVVVAKAKI
jgi:NADH-quinone oxidoreductase subunit J